MQTILSILGALLVLDLLVVIHELGHFWAGKLLGFKILEFSVGMGPILFKVTKNDIIYSLRAFPIGGSCRFYGEDEEIKDAISFNAHKVWKRMIVVLAGPFMNIFIAFLLATITLVSYGDYKIVKNDYIAQISGFAENGSIANESGIEQNDLIVAIDGQDVTFSNVVDTIRNANGEHAIITVNRDGKNLDVEVNNFYNESEGRNMLGIIITPAREHYGFFAAVGKSASYVIEIMSEMIKFIGSLFTTGIESGSVVGPVGTIEIIGQAVRQSFETVLRMAVLISVNLGIMNILPFPALDGGRFAFMVIEAIRRKPVSLNGEATVHFIGIMILFGLVIYLTVSDILRSHR